jgi:putative ABC transport system permease protein
MVPLETARRRLSGTSGAPPGSVRQIALGVARAEDLQYVQEQVEVLLRERHHIAAGDEDDFSVRNISEIVATRTATTRIMSLLLGAVAGISLIVGGIGIMNIMLVSVTERIREIGLRLAVGAGPRDIQRQFLTEAMLISFGGGVLGNAGRAYWARWRWRSSARCRCCWTGAWSRSRPAVRSPPACSFGF